jgi:hypothetical protein
MATMRPARTVQTQDTGTSEVPLFQPAGTAGRGGLLRGHAGLHVLARTGEQLDPPLYDHDTC